MKPRLEFAILRGYHTNQPVRSSRKHTFLKHADCFEAAHGQTRYTYGFIHCTILLCSLRRRQRDEFVGLEFPNEGLLVVL
jgi:hypothetical protein